MDTQNSQRAQSPDDEDGPRPLANDYGAMMDRLLPIDQGLEIEEQTHYTWRLPNWTEMEKIEHGPKFECAGSPWRIFMYPRGNNTEHLSLYLRHGYEDDANHRFYDEEADWGFTKFRELRKLLGQLGDTPSLLGNEEVNVTAYVRVIKDPTGVLWHNMLNYDSKKVTGMVGLKNLGSTGYLNVVLQLFYFLGAFRKATYQVPLDDQSKKGTFLWAIQRLFYSLQTSSETVSTMELASALGWGPMQFFEQHDVQEMLSILQHRFDEEWKRIFGENKLSNLFQSRLKVTSSINGEEHSTAEHYSQISLNVLSMRSLDASFEDYLQEQVRQEGGQRVTLNCAFERFSPVLLLNLKRTSYDNTRRQLVKVNDLLEFPEHFDVSPYLSPEADRSESWIYQLVGVVVHSGGIFGGSYWIYLRPKPNGPFFKFDDDRVTPVLLKEAMEDNYGGDGQSKNAYILIYIRKSRLGEILAPVTDNDVPESIKTEFQRDKEATSRAIKERQENLLYIKLSLVTDVSFRNYHGFDLTNDRLEPDDAGAPTVLRVLEETQLSNVINQIATERGLVPEQIRLWHFVNRQNKTCRPYMPITNDNITIQQAFAQMGASARTANGISFLWVEVGDVVSGKVSPFPAVDGTKGASVIFLKYFDVVNQTLTGVGHIYVRPDDPVGPPVLKAMGWPMGTEFTLYEEVKPSMISKVDLRMMTFARAELGTGDIICVQKVVKRNELPDSVVYKNVAEYFDNLTNEINTKKLGGLNLN
ncbi:hypothetical protein FQN55_005407 [Onygenales sp. PD_40]|nr:hypothetical protein FQN55_005407 [Onygenales sp. PD_40]